MNIYPYLLFCFPRTRRHTNRLLDAIALVTVVSFVVPPINFLVLDASQPRFSPEQFNLPPNAREVVSKRTDKTATFEIERGKFAQVSGRTQGVQPVCRSKFCSLMQPIRNLLPSVFATSAGPNSPGTVVNDDSAGTKPWLNDLNNVKASNDTYCYSKVGDFGVYVSNYLRTTEFNFTISAGATISGIKTEIERHTGIGSVKDTEVKIIKSNGALGTENKASGSSWPADMNTYYTYGDESDLWGETWSVDDINHENFGIALSITSDGIGFNDQGYVDHIRMTVYYTEGAPAVVDVPIFSFMSLPLLLIGGLWLAHRIRTDQFLAA